jgi:hypothetical protein
MLKVDGRVGLLDKTVLFQQVLEVGIAMAASSMGRLGHLDHDKSCEVYQIHMIPTVAC